jgi:hypothetical protein
MDAKTFLEQYPLSISDTQAIDAANNGNKVPLVRLLTQCLTAKSKLQSEDTKRAFYGRIGLMNWYTYRIHALIHQIKKRKLRTELTCIFEGES